MLPHGMKAVALYRLVVRSINRSVHFIFVFQTVALNRPVLKIQDQSIQDPLTQDPFIGDPPIKKILALTQEVPLTLIQRYGWSIDIIRFVGPCLCRGDVTATAQSMPRPSEPRERTRRKEKQNGTESEQQRERYTYRKEKKKNTSNDNRDNNSVFLRHRKSKVYTRYIYIKLNHSATATENTKCLKQLNKKRATTLLKKKTPKKQQRQQKNEKRGGDENKKNEEKEKRKIKKEKQRY